MQKGGARYLDSDSKWCLHCLPSFTVSHGGTCHESENFPCLQGGKLTELSALDIRVGDGNPQKSKRSPSRSGCGD